MAEHDYEVSCECGAQWRVRLEADDDAMARVSRAVRTRSSWSTSVRFTQPVVMFDPY
jgi:hypothetical protein